MKREYINIKKKIKKKIELRHNNVLLIEKRRNINATSTNKLNSLINKTSMNREISRLELRSGVSVENYVGNPSLVPKYEKKMNVDYDIVICIPSYNRSKKVKRLIKQFYNQPTKYSFKIILLNDGSFGNWYDFLAEEFPEIIYIKNEKSNGKALHWYCYNQMWNKLRDIECHVILQMDDDFILCDNFLDTIIDLYFDLKIENSGIMAIAPHKWSFQKHSDNEGWWRRKDFVDGIALIDEYIIKLMDYGMKPVDIKAVSKPGAPVRTWVQISDAIKKTGGIIYRTEFSLVYHDGNNDSKLHGDVRKDGKTGVYTQKYIGEL